jgi:hypothetical protein
MLRYHPRSRTHDQEPFFVAPRQHFVSGMEPKCSTSLLLPKLGEAARGDQAQEQAKDLAERMEVEKTTEER